MGAIAGLVSPGYPVNVLQGEELALNDIGIHALPVPHDCVEPLAFVFEQRQKFYGHFTDLGYVPDALTPYFERLDALTLESNYDPWMLRHGPYPRYLQTRIEGKTGHLSNPAALETVKLHTRLKLKYLVLGHLSQKNNTPAKVLDTFLPLKSARAQMKMAIARPDKPLPTMDL